MGWNMLKSLEKSIADLEEDKICLIKSIKECKMITLWETSKKRKF